MQTMISKQSKIYEELREFSSLCLSDGDAHCDNPRSCDCLFHTKRQWSSKLSLLSTLTISDEMAAEPDVLVGSQLPDEEITMVQTQITSDSPLKVIEEVKLDEQEEAERELFMSELYKLRLKPKSAASLWRLKQTSMKRRTLEASSELLRERLWNLQQESSDQDHRIDHSMDELIKHQQETDELLALSDNTVNQSELHTTSQSSPKHLNDGGPVGLRIDVPLIKWTTEDVETWLNASNLEKLAPTFKAHHVKGCDLAEISLQLLDDLGIHSIDDRELLLSKLYDLQQPSLDDPDLTRKASSQNKLKNMVSTCKHGGHQKATETIRITHDILGFQSSTDVKIHESMTSEEVVRCILEELEVNDDSNLFFLSVTAPHIDTGDGELGRFECPLSVIRQSSAGSTLFDLRKRLGITIKVMCQMTGIKPRGKVFWVSPFSTYTELLQVALRQFKLSPVDTDLFCLLPINKDTGDVRLMSDTEIVQDCETEAFVLTHQENVDHLLITTDHTLTLLEQNKRILRRNSSLNSHGSSALSQSSEASQGSDPGKQPRNDKLESLEARMADIEASLSSNLRDVEEESHEPKPFLMPQVGCVRHSSVLPETPRSSAVLPETPHKSTQPLHTRRMSRYITPKKQHLPSSDSYVPQEIASDDHLELMREIALMRESVHERDSTISSLRRRNSLLYAQSQEVEGLKAQLAEFNMKQEEQCWQEASNVQLTATHQAIEVKLEKSEHTNHQTLRVEQQRRQAEDDDSDSGRETNPSTRNSMPGSTSDLSNDIEQLERELLEANNKAHSLEEELADLRLRHHKALHESRLTGNTINVQLLAEDASISEAKLLQIKQRHANLYARLELTRRETAQTHSTKSAPCLYDTLSPGPAQCVLAVELACPDGPGFMSGRDQRNRAIVKHVADGLPLCKGDRLLEVNGQRVFHMDDQDLQHVLRQRVTPIRLVVIRDIKDQPMRSPNTKEDLESVKEDLSLAMLEVESAQQENQDLTREVEKLKTNNERLKEENADLRKELHIIKMQMGQWPGGKSQENNTTGGKPAAGIVGHEQRTSTWNDVEPSGKKKFHLMDNVHMASTKSDSPHLTNGISAQLEKEGSASGVKRSHTGDQPTEDVP